MELGGRGREGREIIRYVLLVLPECYEIVIWIEIVTGEPSRKKSQIIYTNTQHPESICFLVYVKKIWNKEVTQSACIKNKIKQNKTNQPKLYTLKNKLKNTVHGKPIGINTDFPVNLFYVYPGFQGNKEYLVWKSCSQTSIMVHNTKGKSL